jgi:hypothetical protein
MTPIKGTDDESFLIIYGFLFRHFSFVWLFIFSVQISLLMMIYAKWDFLVSLLPF